MQPPPYTLAQLADLTGESERTIRYYIGQGLLPPAHGRGRASYYDRVHADRLGFIARLRAETGTTLPLRVIRDLFDRLDPETVHRVATGEERLAVADLLEAPPLQVRETPESFDAHAVFDTVPAPPVRGKPRRPRPRRASEPPTTTIQLGDDLELRLRGDDPERVAWLARLARRIRELIREGDT